MYFPPWCCINGYYHVCNVQFRTAPSCSFCDCSLSFRGSFKAICSGFNVRSSGWGYREKCERKDAPGANCNRKTPKGNKCATLQWNKHLWCHKTNQARIFLTHLKTNTCESASFCVSVCLLLCKSILVLVLVLRPFRPASGPHVFDYMAKILCVFCVWLRLLEPGK